jgi:phospholipid transport system substrate-binding protein
MFPALCSNRHRSFDSARENKVLRPQNHLKRGATANLLISYGNCGVWWRLLHNAADSPQEMRGRLKDVIDSTVDVDDVGRFWRLATPDQQKQYMALFHELMVVKIADHLGEYKGVHVAVGLARRSADTEIVITTVEGPRTSTHRVDWVISTATGAPKIVDLLAGGTSLRLTQSADFISYLTHYNYNIQDFIDAMRQMLARPPNVRH